MREANAAEVLGGDAALDEGREASKEAESIEARSEDDDDDDEETDDEVMVALAGVVTVDECRNEVEWARRATGTTNEEEEDDEDDEDDDAAVVDAALKGMGDARSTTVRGEGVYPLRVV